ncbi:uncharacterized protein (TIGR02271 family) [Herbihabitans rhizosphaerae]|uniref:Uncharacterized protein (TIGR02271 family) n=1 Tax=Herbihabitans rhizosphaerae TaxID=1872711 RepID=A0A4Q7L569_9PSEU|nr:PRC and DUF2382 domain-containing protein [Herbihabitans rhizosphaerae]RZS44789.1 uncharacterized protein (TIGR02271 family) [Herbihabitans rhizosphaerae]
MTSAMKPQDLIGSEVYDTDGEKIGRVGTVYVGEDSHEPEWVTVKTGLFGHRESFVPLSGASNAKDGLHVGVRKEIVKDAPHVDAEGRLTEDESRNLYEYYGMPIQRGSKPPTTGKTGTDDMSGTSSGTAGMAGMAGGTAAGMAGRSTMPRQQSDTKADLAGQARSGASPGTMPRTSRTDMGTTDKTMADRSTADTSAMGGTVSPMTGRAKSDSSRGTHAMRDSDRTDRMSTSDSAASKPHTMIRSEERLDVGTEQVESGRVTLRKYVVTEQQQVTVPLSHEEVRLEREPISETDRTAVAKGSAIGEQEEEIVLHEERPVIRKETVAVERVRLNTETVTEERTINDQIRKERIEVDDPTHHSKDTGKHGTTPPRGGR